MRDGPEAGLRLIDALLADGELDGYTPGVFYQDPYRPPGVDY